MADTALKSWLQDTGRDIARAVGSELKNQAKDKAVSLAKEQLGLGLADELGELARDVGGELKSAAKEKAVSMAKDKLQELSEKYFSGAGTAAQAVRVCAYNVTTLRKIVTKFRRELSSLPPWMFLHMHAEIGLRTKAIKLSSKRSMGVNLAMFKAASKRTARSGGYGAAEKKRLIKKLKTRFHGTPPSKMNRDQLISYIYSVARDLHVDWIPFFETFVESKRIRKGCRRKVGPGEVEYDATPGRKRPASAYNKFVREMMLTYDFDSGTSQKDKMKEIGKLWATEKLSILDEEHFADVDEEDRAEALARKQKRGIVYKKLKKSKRVPKKGDDDDLDIDEPNRGPPGIRQSRGIKRVGNQNRVMLSDDSDDE
jgi:hypothetical protein